MSSAFRHFHFNQRANRSREETRKTDGGMAPTAGVSRSEAEVPENLRAVSYHGQPMQAQASRESGRSWPQAVVVMAMQVSWKERRLGCPETGNISRWRVTGGADLTINQPANQHGQG